VAGALAAVIASSPQLDASVKLAPVMTEINDKYVSQDERPALV